MSATFTLQVEAIDSVDLAVTLKVWATAAASILDTAFTRGFVLSSLTNGPYGASKSDYEKRNGMIASWAKSRYKSALANEAFPSFLYEEDPSRGAAMAVAVTSPWRRSASLSRASRRAWITAGRTGRLRLRAWSTTVIA